MINRRYTLRTHKCTPRDSLSLQTMQPSWMRWDHHSSDRAATRKKQLLQLLLVLVLLWLSTCVCVWGGGATWFAMAIHALA